MASVSWLPEALEDVQRLYKFLYEKSPQAATRAASIILKGATLLESTTRIGRPMPDESGRRELFMTYGSGAYVLRYMHESEDLIIILRVWHSRENRELEQ